MNNSKAEKTLSSKLYINSQIAHYPPGMVTILITCHCYTKEHSVSVLFPPTELFDDSLLFHLTTHFYQNLICNGLHTVRQQSLWKAGVQLLLWIWGWGVLGDNQMEMQYSFIRFVPAKQLLILRVSVNWSLCWSPMRVHVPSMVCYQLPGNFCILLWHPIDVHVHIIHHLKAELLLIPMMYASKG